MALKSKPIEEPSLLGTFMTISQMTNRAVKMKTPNRNRRLRNQMTAKKETDSCTLTKSAKFWAMLRDSPQVIGSQEILSSSRKGDLLRLEKVRVHLVVLPLSNRRQLRRILRVLDPNLICSQSKMMQLGA